jgi:hypothetical protein
MNKRKLKIKKTPRYKLLTLVCAAVIIFSFSGATYHYLSYHKATINAPSITPKHALTNSRQPVIDKSPTTTNTPKSQPKNEAPSPAPTPQPVIQTLDQIVTSINQQLQTYGVTATLTPPNNTYTYSTWSPLDSSDVSRLQQFSNYLTLEFSKYKTDLVINSGLKIIGLVKNIAVSGTARAAAPAPSIAGMLYDVNSMVNAGSAYAREVVSHEYWHYIDYRLVGSYSYSDAQWDACNTAGFTYGSGGVTAYGVDSGYVSAFHPRTGFITAYSEYAMNEDRAELFGWLMYDPSTVKSLKDTNINCKITRLTAIIHQLSPLTTF